MPGEPSPEPNFELLRSLFFEVARGAPIVIDAYDLEGKILLHMGKGLERLGLQPNQFHGMSVFDVFAGAEEALSQIRGALKGELSSNIQDYGNCVLETWYCPLRDASGRIFAAASISNDITERELARRELADRLATIEAQTQAIRRMGVPIIQVWQDVLVLPIVGDLDSERTSMIMERLLESLVNSRARHAILDLTGVENIDTHTANQLLQILGAVTLLGVQGLVSGIRPDVAQAFVNIGVDLSRVTTAATLHDALRRCMLDSSARAARQRQS